MRGGANFLVLDEPTNHLDIDSVEMLEAAIEWFDGTVVVVSHDRYFLDRIADRIVEVGGGGATRSRAATDLVCPPARPGHRPCNNGV